MSDDEAEWERVQDAMRQILDHTGLKYYEADGEAAFYGPKLDIQFKNVFGKEDTLFTVQIDLLTRGTVPDGPMWTGTDRKKRRISSTVPRSAAMNVRLLC